MDIEVYEDSDFWNSLVSPEEYSEEQGKFILDECDHIVEKINGVLHGCTKCGKPIA